jgi:hypothetical protein
VRASSKSEEESNEVGLEDAFQLGLGAELEGFSIHRSTMLARSHDLAIESQVMTIIRILEIAIGEKRKAPHR